MKSQHLSESSMLAGTTDPLKANLIKMLRDDAKGQQPFNAHGVELNANWHKDRYPNNPVTKFSQKYGFFGPDLLKEYKRRYPDVLVEYGKMEPEEPSPEPMPSKNAGQPLTAVQPKEAGFGWLGVGLLVAVAGGAWWKFRGDKKDDQKNKKKSN